MRGVILSVLFVVLVIVAAGAGLFGQLPGLMIIAFCFGPFAFIGFGFALARATSGRRLGWVAAESPSPAGRPIRRVAPPV